MLRPADVIDIVREQSGARLTDRSHEGVFTFGLLLALWSSSAAMVGITDALNRAYDIEEARPWWKVRLTAIALTIGVAVFVVVAFALVMIGPTLADLLAPRSRIRGVVRDAVEDPAVAVRVRARRTAASACIYYFAPDAEQDWEWITPGAVAGDGALARRLARVQVLRRPISATTTRPTDRSAA